MATKRAPKRTQVASAASSIPSGPLETGKTAEERHEQRKSWFLAEASKQAPNRAMMARCEAIYDSEHWTTAEAKELNDRGQNPVVYNEVKPVIDWLIGTERRTRVDFFIVSEDDGDAAEEDAQNKTKLLKYLDDVNRAAFERSYAAEDQFKAGVGWLEVGLRGDKTGIPLYIGAESWRNILWDSNDRRRDLSNARYLFRVKVIDYDVALAIFPDNKEMIDRCVQEGDNVSVFSTWLAGTGLISGLDAFGTDAANNDFMTSRPVDLFNPRRRVLLLECWSREPQRRTPSEDGLGDPVTMKMRVSIMTEHDTLIESWSPFKHDGFPFIPLWAYVNRRTGLPYSPIRPLIGPQEALNHRMSKSLMEASSNQIKIESGAINDEAMNLETVRSELNSPDGIAVFADGALSGGKVQERPNGGAATAQLQLADRDILSIRVTSGVSADSQGATSNSTSGKMVLAKQEQSGVLNAELFDNQLLARQMEGDITLSLAEQFIRAPMVIRVAGEGNKVERTKINEPQADGTYLNDISARRAHFVVGEQAWKQSYAEAAFESLMEIMTQLSSTAPQMVINLLDVVFEMNPNLPRKKQLLARIRQVNGQQDPDDKQTPEQQQAQAEAAAKAKAEYEATMAKMQADIKEIIARGEKFDAEAMKSRLDALYVSAQAAQVLVQMPGATPVADELLRSAGFKDAGGQGDVIPAGMVPQLAAPVDPMAQAGIDPAAANPMNGQPAPGGPPPPLMGDGQAAGIETTAPDGVISPQGV